MAITNSGNSVLDELDGLSPAAKNALALANAKLNPQAPVEGDPAAAGMLARNGGAPAPAPAAPVAPVATPRPIASLMPKPPALAPSIAAATDPGIAPLIASAKPLPAAAPFADPNAAAHTADLARLTKVPVPGEHDKTQTGLSGIGQIHSKKFRIPLEIADAFGSAFFPKAMLGIPGTELHHNLLVREAQSNVAHDEAQQANEEKNAETQALTGEANARAFAALHPIAKSAFEAWQAQNPNGTVADWLKLQADSKAATTPFEAWQKQNPNGSATDWMELQAENSPARTAFEAWQKQNPNGKVEDFLKEQAALKTASPEQQYIAEYQRTHPGATIAEAEKQFKVDTQTPQRAPESLMLVPDGQGGYVAQSVAAGAHVAPGAVSTSGLSSMDVPTAATRTMAETAPKVIDLANRVSQLVNEQEKSLGPAASRWNEFMAGKVGAPNPDFTKLRTDVGLLTTALMRMHVGARGGERIMEHFQNLIDVSKQSPENLKAAIGEIVAYAQAVQSEGKPAGEQPQGGATVPYQFNGRTYNIPADEEKAFLHDHPKAKKVQQ